MMVHLRLTSANDTVRRLVADFARGLGCTVKSGGSEGALSFRAELPDTDTLIELLTHVALTATKAGIDVAEPLCRVTYRHP
jgi:hypothetical protein